MTRRLQRNNDGQTPRTSKSRGSRITSRMKHYTLRSLSSKRAISLITNIRTRTSQQDSRASNRANSRRNARLRQQRTMLRRSQRRSKNRRRSNQTSVSRNTSRRSRRVGSRYGNPHKRIRKRRRNACHLQRLLRNRRPYGSNNGTSSRRSKKEESRNLFRDLPSALPYRLLMSRRTRRRKVRRNRANAFKYDTRTRKGTSSSRRQRSRNEGTKGRTLNNTLTIGLSLFQVPTLLNTSSMRRRRLNRASRSTKRNAYRRRHARQYAKSRKMGSRKNKKQSSRTRNKKYRHSANEDFQQMPFLLRNKSRSKARDQNVNREKTKGATGSRKDRSIRFTRAATSKPRRLRTRISSTLNSTTNIRRLADRRRRQRNSRRLAMNAIPRTLQRRNGGNEYVSRSMNRAKDTSNRDRQSTRHNGRSRRRRGSRRYRDYMFSPFHLYIIATRHLVLKHGMKGVNLMRNSSLSRSTSNASSTTRQRSTMRVRRKSLRTLASLLANGTRVLRTLVNRRRRRDRRSRMVSSDRPTLTNELSAIMGSISRSILILSRISTRTPRNNGNGRNNIRLYRLLPTRKRTMTHGGNGSRGDYRRYRNSRTSNGMCIGRLLTSFFRLFSNTRPLSIVLRLFPLTYCDEKRPTNYPLTFAMA